MMWSTDALDPLRRSLRVCASDSISVPCVECTKSRKNLSTLSYIALVDGAQPPRESAELKSPPSPIIIRRCVRAASTIALKR